MKNNQTMVTIAALIVGAVLGFSLKEGSHSMTQKMPDGSVVSSSTGMHCMMDNMSAMLEGKTGDDFDKVFLEEMIVHHEGAVDMAEIALKSAKHQEIKDMSKAIISAQMAEIAQMKGWLKDWYNK